VLRSRELYSPGLFAWLSWRRLHPARSLLLPIDLLEDQAPWAPTVIANLTPVLHREVSARLQRPPERLLAAGFLARHADDVAPLYAPLSEADRAVEGEWAAVSLA